MIIGRYAPSPTGAQHFGNLRTALLCWLQVRLQDGQFILRIDDLDTPRTRPGSLESIVHDLQWLGIDWDLGPGSGASTIDYMQSERFGYYADAFNALGKDRRLFPCTCSRKDIAMAASAPHPGDRGNRYPGTCRPKTPDGHPVSNPDQPHNWRFRVDNQDVLFEDRILGPRQEQVACKVGDFVVKRKDGAFAYQLATVVDDGHMGVTDVVRGADLVDSTARQILLFKALGYPVPRFWHVPLMNDADGNRMSKRDGSESAEQWRSGHRSAEQLVGYLASSAGLIDTDKPLSCKELLKHLNIDSFTQSLKLASEQ